MNGKWGFLRHSLPSVSSWGGGYGYTNKHTNKHTNKQLYLRRVTHNSSSTDELVVLDPQSTIIRSKIHLRIIKLVDRSVIIYIISSVMHAFWLVLTYDLLEDRRIDDVIVKTFFNSLLYKTNRFQVAVRLFSNRSQRTSKCGKNISDTLGCASCATFLF